MDSSSTSKPFVCKRCGNCCRWPGMVSVSPEERQAIAAFLGITEDAFIQTYMRLSPDRTKLILEDAPGSTACVFLAEDNTCRIYPKRPLQCKTFPDAWDVPPDFQKLCKGRC